MLAKKQEGSSMGLVKRRYYKRERRPARHKDNIADFAPLGCPDANESEVRSAVFAVAKQMTNAIVGRAGEYDRDRDEYVVIAKILDGGTMADGFPSGKVGDLKIPGELVAEAIIIARTLNGGKNDKGWFKRYADRLQGIKDVG
jgi:hypothetical protein